MPAASTPSRPTTPRGSLTGTRSAAAGTVTSAARAATSSPPGYSTGPGTSSSASPTTSSRRMGSGSNRSAGWHGAPPRPQPTAATIVAGSPGPPRPQAVQRPQGRLRGHPLLSTHIGAWASRLPPFFISFPLSAMPLGHDLLSDEPWRGLPVHLVDRRSSAAIRERFFTSRWWILQATS